MPGGKVPFSNLHNTIHTTKVFLATFPPYVIQILRIPKIFGPKIRVAQPIAFCAANTHPKTSRTKTIIAAVVMSTKKTVSREEWEKKCADVKLSKGYPTVVPVYQIN